MGGWLAGLAGNKANSAQLKLELGLSLAIVELLICLIVEMLKSWIVELLNC